MLVILFLSAYFQLERTKTLKKRVLTTSKLKAKRLFFNVLLTLESAQYAL